MYKGKHLTFIYFYNETACRIFPGHNDRYGYFVYQIIKLDYDLKTNGSKAGCIFIDRSNVLCFWPTVSSYIAHPWAKEMDHFCAFCSHVSLCGNG